MQTFDKTERITSKLLIDRLFERECTSIVAFPFRVVYTLIPHGESPVSILISVPKRRFRHAVDRNRMKRQVREAYRKQKQELWSLLKGRSESLAIAFVCIASEPCTSEFINRSISKALHHIATEL